MDVTAEHQKGAAEIKEGQATMKLATIDQDKLRVIAAAKRDAIKSGAAATDAAMLTVVTAQWPDVFASMTEKVLSSLWDQNYKKIYLADVYSFEEPNYVAKPGLTDQIRQQLVTLDKGKDTFSAAHDWSFKLGQENGKLILSYPDRAYVQQGNTKAALILGEVLYESHDGYAAVDLRAVDLDTMHIVANQIMMLSVDPSLGKLLGLASYKAMSKRILPTADSKARRPGDGDQRQSAGPQRCFCRARKKPPTPSASARWAMWTRWKTAFGILLLKSYLRDQQSDLNTFRTRTFSPWFLRPKIPVICPPARRMSAREWLLPDISDLSPSIELNTLKLHVLGGNSDRDVGKITHRSRFAEADRPIGGRLARGRLHRRPLASGLGAIGWGIYPQARRLARPCPGLLLRLPSPA